MKSLNGIKDVYFTHSFVLGAFPCELKDNKTGVKFVLPVKDIQSFQLEHPNFGSYWVGVSAIFSNFGSAGLDITNDAAGLSIICPQTQHSSQSGADRGQLYFFSRKSFDADHFIDTTFGEERMRILTYGLVNKNIIFYIANSQCQPVVVKSSGFDYTGCSLIVTLARSRTVLGV